MKLTKNYNKIRIDKDYKIKIANNYNKIGNDDENIASNK